MRIGITIKMAMSEKRTISVNGCSSFTEVSVECSGEDSFFEKSDISRTN